ncbi:hypothetical protein NDN01_20365 [Sphingomonas sp. QA11]|uniref:hypothetical protein n=1 Tax=Sphingomonas sp. QA11 TaxID=2950605 RepID=UPI00234B0501|nr:hypothetical protein [Sphingomonas sp. QA11]WCM26336.1 hypothetical protein NDN01_20365 [Sphingomonas sp. QA11]
MKRDDLFSLEPSGRTRGGKLRQCAALVIGSGAARVITAASIHSPQSAIVADVARYLGIPSVVFCGGQMMTRPISIAQELGAEVKRCASGRHTVLFAEARRLCRSDDLIVPFGMRPAAPDPLFYSLCSAQVRNLPNHLNTIVLACGSGATALSVLLGLSRERRVCRLLLVNVGPDRRNWILSMLEILDPEAAAWAIRNVTIEAAPLAQHPEFRYEARVDYELGGVPLHPLYEGKAFRWLLESQGDRIDAARTLFWLVGPPLQ